MGRKREILQGVRKQGQIVSWGMRKFKFLNMLPVKSKPKITWNILKMEKLLSLPILPLHRPIQRLIVKLRRVDWKTRTYHSTWARNLDGEMCSSTMPSKPTLLLLPEQMCCFFPWACFLNFFLWFFQRCRHSILVIINLYVAYHFSAGSYMSAGIPSPF